MEVLKLALDKLSQYNFLTNIVPGTLLCVLLKYFVGYNIIPNNNYHAAIVFYFVGMVNSRISSLVVEPFLKKTKWIIFAPYKKYLFAESKDEKVAVLNQENNVYRSYLAVLFVTAIMYVYKRWLIFIPYVAQNEKILLLIGLICLFLFAYRKQTSFVRKRVEYKCEKEGYEE